MKAGHLQERVAAAQRRVVDFKRLVEAGLLEKSGDFFASVHYPPITMYPPITEEEMFKGYTVPEDGKFDVYAHIPFCHRQCLFCHYPGKFGEKQGAEKEKYLSYFEREMDLYMRRLGVDKIKVRSILVGGGTPTFLTPGQLRRFLEFFTRRLDLSSIRQFNYDVDPATLVGPEGMERLHIMRDFGVDRLTIGVQSLDAEILSLMNRPHDLQQVFESIENSRKLGYQLNIEFIFGHPGETIENWVDVMEQAVKLDVDEIQLYRLKVAAYGDKQGAIKKFKHIHPDRVPTVDETLLMKQLAIDILNEHGYTENLRRVFSKQRRHFSVYAHNQCCLLRDEIGLGLTAFSSLRNRFVLNTQFFEEYYDRIDKGQLPLNRGLVRSREDQIRWSIVLPLKNREVRKNVFKASTGVDFNSVFRPKIEKLKALGLVEEDERAMWLTPLGAFFADEVVEQFHDPKYCPFPRESYLPGPLNPYDNTDPYAGG
jgi:oxygen-independent coproporphyrinogen-3 oxidase